MRSVFSKGQFFRIKNNEIDRFAELSSDINELHMDDNYAKLNNFSGRVTHGAYIALSLMNSTRNLLNSQFEFNFDFLNPVISEEIYEINFQQVDSKTVSFRIFRETTTQIQGNIWIDKTINARKIRFISKPKVRINLDNLLRINPNIVGALSIASHHVGMIEPGELSILRRIRISRLNMGNVSGKKIYNYKEFSNIYTFENTVGDVDVQTISLERNFTDFKKTFLFFSKNVTKIDTKISATVIGCTGALGSIITIFLLLRGIRVTGVVRNRDTKANYLEKILVEFGLPFNLIVLDVKKYSNFSSCKVLSGITNLLFYCASPYIGANLDSYNESTTQEYINIFSSGLELSVKFFKPDVGLFVPSSIYLSSDVNGNMENDKLGLHEYIEAKQNQEKVARELSNHHCLDLFMPRLGKFKSRHYGSVLNLEFDRDLDSVLIKVIAEIDDWIINMTK